VMLLPHVTAALFIMDSGRDFEEINFNLSIKNISIKFYHQD
jgi:hypothetical protein